MHQHKQGNKKLALNAPAILNCLCTAKHLYYNEVLGVLQALCCIAAKSFFAEKGLKGLCCIA